MGGVVGRIARVCRKPPQIDMTYRFPQGRPSNINHCSHGNQVVNIFFFEIRLKISNPPPQSANQTSRNVTTLTF